MFPLANKNPISIGVLLFAVTVLSPACSDSSFKSGSKQNPGRSDNGVPLPFPANSPNPIIDMTEGGIRNRNIKSIYFSGNGPGSCGGADNCVPAAPACIAPAVKLESAAMQGDCFVCASFPGKCQYWSKDHFCNGNRAVCTDVSKTAADVTLQLHLTFDAACPTTGFVPSGPAGGNYHVLGLVGQSGTNTNFSTVSLCKRTKPAVQVKSGDYLVTDIKFMTPGQRLKTLPPEAQRCPVSDPAGAFKWAEVGVIPDCGTSPVVGVTPDGEKGVCSGFLVVCQKTERIP